MIKLGDYNTMEVSRFTASGAYLKLDEEEALLPRRFVNPEMKAGDKIEVFIFTDSEDRLTATTQKPKARVGEFAYLKVIDTNKYGAFMDWGLDKDLMVPFSEQKDKMEKGRKYIVRIVHDYKSRRLIGTSKIRDFFKSNTSGLAPQQKVDLMVFGETELGIKVIIDNQYEGLLYKNEVFEPLGMGERTTGYIKKIREDGKLDVTLYKGGLDGIKEAETFILNRLKQEGGYLPYNDSTPPDTIRDQLLMSKKVFKKAIGSLYKSGTIIFQEDGFILNKTGKKPLFARIRQEENEKAPTRKKSEKFSEGKIKNKQLKKEPRKKSPLENRVRRRKEDKN